jgi:hypothetical protein
LVIIEVVSHVQNLNTWAMTGWKSTPRCAWLRCRYKVTEKIVSWVAARKYSASSQKEHCSRPLARKSMIADWDAKAGIAGSAKGVTATLHHDAMWYRNGRGTWSRKS